MAPKKKVGIIGGMGSHATLWLFQRLIHLTNASKDQDYPEIIVHNNCNVPDRTKAILHGGESPLKELKKSIDLFNHAEIDVAVMACMTAHYYYDDLANDFDGKLINPIEIIVEKLMYSPEYQSKKRIGILGTTGFIRSGILTERLILHDFETILLSPYEQEKYFMQPLYGRNGIKAGKDNEEIRSLFLQQIPLLQQRGAQVIIGACSEVPLLVNAKQNILFLDAIESLAEKTIEYCFQSEEELSK